MTETDTAASPVPNPLMADPPIWPVCSTCEVPYVLRRGLSMTKGWMWVWQADCKHKRAESVICDRDGPVQLYKPTPDNTERPVCPVCAAPHAEQDCPHVATGQDITDGPVQP